MDRKSEGKLVIDQQQNELYYRFAGQGAETLICLHGGPGQGSGYMKVMEQIQVENLKLLFYDQLGSGASSPGHNVQWGVQKFVDDLEALRSKLQLGNVHLFGHSWGGMLAIQYAIDHGSEIKSLILSNTASDMASIMGAIQRLQSSLPEEHYRALVKAMCGRKVPAEELEQAKLEFNARYLRREAPFEIEHSKQRFRELFPATREGYGPSFRGLWGEDPYTCGCMPCNGPLLDWKATENLHRIKVPTLILGGMYDEITPELHAVLAEKIPDNYFVIFGNSSHFITHEKECYLYLSVIETFLRKMVHAG